MRSRFTRRGNEAGFRGAAVAAAIGLVLQAGCATRAPEAYTPIPATAAAAPAAEVPAPKNRDPAPPYVILHKVEGGESLWEIARRYGVTVADLAQGNRIRDPNHIRMGQEIEVLIEAKP